MKPFLRFLHALTALLYPAFGASCSSPEDPGSETAAPHLTVGAIPVYTYRVVTTYRHDPEAFTQGLVYEDGAFYEGTGLYGKSTLRKFWPENADTEIEIPIADEYFGEGVTIFGDRLIQLTWKANTGFLYDKATFTKTGEFSYPTEGWGITHDGERLIMSDGSSYLHFLDPETFEETGRIRVFGEGGFVGSLNELEYIEGEVFANIWPESYIARIDPETGAVLGWIELAGILPPEDQIGGLQVANGIAYDSELGRIFVTGKLWPKLFEVELIPFR